MAATRLRLQFREGARTALKAPMKKTPSLVGTATASRPSRLNPPPAASHASPWDAMLAVCHGDPSGWEATMTALFWAMESDGSGALDTHELAQGLRKLGVAMTKAQATGVTPRARTRANSPA